MGMKETVSLRAILHYLAMMIIIPVYGIQVCPFIEGQNPAEVFLTINSLLLVTFIGRSLLIPVLINPLPLSQQAW